MSKERLEEIMSRISSIQNGMPKEVITWKGWEPVVTVFTKDVEYLIERVQELEGAIKGSAVITNIASAENAELKQQNERYREAMERAIKYSNAGRFTDAKDSKVAKILRIELEGESK